MKHNFWNEIIKVLISVFNNMKYLKPEVEEDKN